MANFIYRFRGLILALFAIALLAFPSYEGTISASGFLLIVLAVALRITARRSIGMHSRGNALSAPRLVREGIYSKVRHPLYLSNGLMGSGFVLLHLNWQVSTFVFVGVLWLFVGVLALNEDTFLRQEFGEEWNQFAREVPAFVPNLKGPRNKNYVRSAWAAFAGDLWTWIFLLVFAAMIFLRRYA